MLIFIGVPNVTSSGKISIEGDDTSESEGEEVVELLPSRDQPRQSATIMAV